MLLRGLFFAILLYLLYRFISRKLGGGQSQQRSRQTQRFDRQRQDSTANNGRRKKNLDQIEEAEFEDITEKKEK